ncbi:MAG: iron-containing alcohol dehydrogenase [Arcobacter sp.]|jgi:NADP-dependent alcohol dehydrogenase|uniref:iron-containing alcohol dehydrogenase n=1 Tax=Arcobacter sp. TaxID=1872629 RepID=UPI002A74C072|nr:iron-containing alcohol dehydrogenase [Arcobacter sp.]MDY3200466.1 iron-containing alcohol dehydrogenase [Arcobacter sp.]
MEFSYLNPTHIEFGERKINTISTHIPKTNRVLFIYGGGSIKKNGVYNQVVNALNDYIWFEFGGVEPNPTKETLDKAIALAKKEKIDFILAVGGGSVIDGAKYIAHSYYYEGDGWDILEGKYISQKALPIGAIVTLAATGSESNTGSVITKAQTKEKRFFRSVHSFPKFAVLDPSVLKSLDDRQITNGLVDAFVHTCEQYLTYKHGMLAQDNYAEGILRGLIQLASTIDKKDDLWYANLLWLANQAFNGLIALGVPQDWATHYIGHELTGLYGIDHARTLAIIQPNLYRVLKEHKTGKLLQVGKNVFGIVTNDSDIIIDKIESFYKSLGIELKISSYTNDKEIIEKVIPLLVKHGFSKLGENQIVDTKIVEKVLQKSI